MLIDRRGLLAGTGLLLTLPGSAFAQRRSEIGGQQDLVPLWPGEAPGGGGPGGPVAMSEKGAMSNIAVPALEVYRPTRPNGAAMLVAAGGGYKRIEMENEARPAARWLAARGITAFVLRYRLPGEGWREGPLAPLQDAQRALRVIAADGVHHGIDAGRIGVLGFSSGGHLMGLAATRAAFASYRPVDGIDTAAARTAEAALIYPVVTLEPPYDHTSTRIELIGRHPSAAASADWSVQTHVREHCPPMFLVQAEDDPISNIANSAILEQACKSAGVSVDRHVLPSGGHGFGMGTPGTPTGQWPGWCASWLSSHGA